MIRLTLPAVALLLTVGTSYGQIQFQAVALPGLTSAQKSLFTQGQSIFTKTWTAQTGLGPIYNDVGCTRCHPNGNGSFARGQIIGEGTLQYADGGPNIQIKSLPRFVAETIPTNVPVAFRRSMTTRGLGLIGNIPDQSILALQASQTSSDTTTAGQARIVVDAVTGETRVGRIGQKCQHPNSTSFAADAFLNEIGITTPFFPNENAAFNNPANLNNNPFPGVNDSGNSVILAGHFMDLSAPPKSSNQPRTTAQKNSVSRGSNLFSTIGCATCHNPTWTTGSSTGVAALDNQIISPYSDFLLHDMGASGDQIQQGTNSNGQPIPGSWMRTTPLWGVSTNTNLWHDGTANSVTAAISKHAGQAAGALSRYNSLSSSSKQDLLNFLNSL
ncbi:MAG: di-heme oxidoredictase family protein [Planctomycetaceae bacterium]